MEDPDSVPTWKRSKEYGHWEHVQILFQKLSEIKNPDQALQEQREKLDAERGDIKSAAVRRLPMPDPDTQAKLLRYLDKIFECGRKRGALDPGYPDMARELDEDWKRGYRTVHGKFLERTSRDRQFPFRALSPSPSPTSSAAERNTARHDPFGSSSAAPNTVPEPTRPQNSVRNQRISKRPQLANISEAARDNDEESDSRHDPSPQTPPGAERGPRPGPPAPCRNSKLTIRFDQVYQGGRAHFKYSIGSYGGKFYIFRCDKHQKHIVSRDPVRGATTHLTAYRYDRIVAVNSQQAVELIGIEVLGCDEQKQALNNEALDRNPNMGPRPGEVTRRYRKRSRFGQQEPAATGTTRSRNRRGSAVVGDPVPGEIYLATLGERNALTSTLAVAVLPRDGFDDVGFSEIGLQGTSLAADTDLLDNVPECYVKHPGDGHIVGWREGYEDGGDKRAERQYPVMRLDGTLRPCENSTEWVQIGHLLPYQPRAQSNNRKLISNFMALKQFERQRRGAESSAKSPVRRQRGPRRGATDPSHNQDATDRESSVRDPGPIGSSSNSSVGGPGSTGAMAGAAARASTAPQHLRGTGSQGHPTNRAPSAHSPPLTLVPAELHRCPGENGHPRAPTASEDANAPLGSGSGATVPTATMGPDGYEQPFELTPFSRLTSGL